MYLLEFAYSALAFGEILVLLASAIGVLVLVLQEIVAVLGSAVDKAVNAATSGRESRAKSPNPFTVTAGSRVRRIPGGHNEIF